MQYDKYESPMGPLWLQGEGGVLSGLSFEGECTAAGMQAAADEFILVKGWLDDYFRGQPRQPDFPMSPAGTAFQRLVWKLLLEVPFGQTRTYGDLAGEAARIMGKEKMSPQAVGQAVGRNPIAIIIPCHRIIGAGGKLTGYYGGIHRKQWLLDHEGR